MDATIYNISGKKAGTITLPENIFGVAWNDSLMHQVVTSMQDNARTNVAHTKTRGEVRGGGKKPWRQKGTGRARHGSTRSPIWVGGGVSGGPRNERNFEREIPKKMRKKALCMVLSEKAKNNLLVVLDSMEMENVKTKMMAQLIKKLPVNNSSRLVLYSNGNKKIYLAGRNIAKTAVLETRNMNMVELL